MAAQRHHDVGERIAASTPGLRTGCRVSLWITRLSKHAAIMVFLGPAAPRYSGSDRPSCLMNHTGLRLLFAASGCAAR